MNNTASEVFLATTALEDFWDTSKPIVFLGEWCKRYSRRTKWDRPQNQTVKSPWENWHQVEKDHLYLSNLADTIRLSLSDSLNQLHGLKQSRRYWCILLGQWLERYLSAVYAHYRTLQAALSQFPNFTTLLLSEKSYFVPQGAANFVWYLSKDFYNLQIVSKIFTALGKEFPRKAMEANFLPNATSIERVRKETKIRSFFDDVLRFAERRFQNGSPVILKEAYFDRPSLIRLFLRSRGRVWPLPSVRLSTRPFPENRTARERLKEWLTADSEFERVLNTMLPFDLPQCFVEGFAELREASKNYPANSKIIVSAIAWQAREDFSQWAADQADRGAFLVGVQHGGNYGSLRWHVSERYELEIVDRFCSWGWEGGTQTQKIIPLPATKLIGIKKMKTHRRNKDILFSSTNSTRYAYLFPYIPSVHFGNYLSWKFRFLDSLPSKIRQLVRLRTHYADYGWDLVERYRDLAPDVRVEDWAIPFLKSLKKCRLYVCDHLSTTFLESLVAEKPTVLFWDSEVNPLRPEARVYYDALASVGILHPSPESAANHLVAVYDDIGSWWEGSECRKVRREFCHQFARTSSNAVREWANQFKEMVRNVQRTEVPLKEAVDG